MIRNNNQAPPPLPQGICLASLFASLLEKRKPCLLWYIHAYTASGNSKHDMPAEGTMVSSVGICTGIQVKFRRVTGFDTIIWRVVSAP